MFVDKNEISLTIDQRSVYESVMSSIESGIGGIYFLHAPGGTGKTFIINLILAKVDTHTAVQCV